MKIIRYLFGQFVYEFKSFIKKVKLIIVIQLEVVKQRKYLNKIFNKDYKVEIIYNC